MNRNRRLPALPYVLLGAMTLASFGGPVAILVMILGGPSAKWPPDRAIEWVTIGLVFGLVITLFIACVSLSVWYSRHGPRPADPHENMGNPANLINQESTGR